MSATDDDAVLRELHAVKRELERLLREPNHAPVDSFVREVTLGPSGIAPTGGGET